MCVSLILLKPSDSTRTFVLKSMFSMCRLKYPPVKMWSRVISERLLPIDAPRYPANCTARFECLLPSTGSRIFGIGHCNFMVISPLCFSYHSEQVGRIPDTLD